MNQPSPPRRVLRFGVYQSDLCAGELHKNGIKVKISELPFRLLTMLLDRPGEVVTRQELAERLWPEQTHSDLTDNLNTAVNKVRAALDDQAENPRFIETLPRRGYRFIGSVEVLDATGSVVHSGLSGLSSDAPEIAGHRVSASSDAANKRRLWLATVAAILLIVAGGAYWVLHSRPAFSFNSRDSVLVADFENETGDARFDRALRTAFTISLGQSERANVFPEDRVDSALGLMGKPGNSPITAALGREICLREGIRGLIAAGITRTGQQYELTAELIDPQTGAVVRSYAQRSNGEDHILDALEAISNDIRRDLGESLYQIHRANKPLPEVTTSSLTALQQFAEGRDLWHKGKYDDAMNSFRAAVASDADFAMAHAALGGGYYSYIYNQQALGKIEYEKALSLASRATDREKLIMQAGYANDQNHVDDANALYRTYLDRYPDDWRMHLDYASFLRLHNQAPEAIVEYQQVLRIAPDDAKTYVEMATAYGEEGKFQQAVDAYSRAFRLEPQQLTAGNIDREYGFTLVALGEDDKATQTFDVMLAKPATETDGIRSLAMLDLYHGRYAAAQKRFEQVLSIWGPKPAAFSAARVRFMMAVISQGDGNSREQMAELDESIAHLKDIGPKVVWGSLVGKEYARAGATDKAQKIFDEIAASTDARNPTEVVYSRVLQAEIAASKGDAASAVQTLAALAPGNELDVSIRAVWLESLAHAYQQQGNIKQAIHWYEVLMALPEGGSASWEPQQRWLESYCTLASDYLQDGNRQKARETLAILADRWKNADAGLQLNKQIQKLQARLTSLPQAG